MLISELWLELQLRRRLLIGSCQYTHWRKKRRLHKVWTALVLCHHWGFHWAHLSPTRNMLPTESTLSRNSLSPKIAILFHWDMISIKVGKGEGKLTVFVCKIQHVSWHSLHYRNLMIGGYFLHPKRLPKMLLQGQVSLHCVILWKTSNSSAHNSCWTWYHSFPLRNFHLPLRGFFSSILSSSQIKANLGTWSPKTQSHTSSSLGIGNMKISNPKSKPKKI